MENRLDLVADDADGGDVLVKADGGKEHFALPRCQVLQRVVGQPVFGCAVFADHFHISVILQGFEDFVKRAVLKHAFLKSGGIDAVDRRVVVLDLQKAERIDGVP